MRFAPLFWCALFVGSVMTAAPAAAAIQATFTTVDVPGADSTEVHGIIRYGPLRRFVEVVGTYHNAQGTHGFLLAQGRYTTLDVPGAHDTWTLGMNDRGEVVGYSAGSDGVQHGFRYVAGKYTVLTCPIGRGTGPFGFTPNAVNDAGVIVGSAGSAGLAFQNGGCVFPARQNALYLYGINNGGQAAGTIVDANNATHGQTLFPLLANEAEMQFDVPGATSTWVTGLNDAGALVGFYRTGTRFFLPTHGFVYTGGAYATLDVPGALRTEPAAIANSSSALGSSLGSFSVVGRYSGWFGAEHGFIASVTSQPESQP